MIDEIIKGLKILSKYSKNIETTENQIFAGAIGPVIERDRLLLESLRWQKIEGDQWTYLIDIEERS